MTKAEMLMHLEYGQYGDIEVMEQGEVRQVAVDNNIMIDGENLSYGGYTMFFVHDGFKYFNIVVTKIHSCGSPDIDSTASGRIAWQSIEEIQAFWDALKAKENNAEMNCSVFPDDAFDY